MTVLTAPPGGSIPGPSIVCAGCGGPVPFSADGLPLPLCLGCAAQVGYEYPAVADPDRGRAVCLEPGCGWFGEDPFPSDLDGLRFRSEFHARVSGHRVGLWYVSGEDRDMGDNPDEVIP